jgi:hypothetical protein
MARPVITITFALLVIMPHLRHTNLAPVTQPNVVALGRSQQGKENGEQPECSDEKMFYNSRPRVLATLRHVQQDQTGRREAQLGSTSGITPPS